VALFGLEIQSAPYDLDKRFREATSTRLFLGSQGKRIWRGMGCAGIALVLQCASNPPIQGGRGKGCCAHLYPPVGLCVHAIVDHNEW
jgi:hypothetical protein